MLYRLTYALTRNDIVTMEFTSDKEIVGATEEAFDLIENQHGAEVLLNLVAFSVLKIEVPNVQQN
ncbi:MULTISPECIES: hypothetical protein [unclassified Paenibacillus]|uniref:hypothetical protein n=1 Tax=unclassified Paenibacillus TaxID=185978 RepID=UPI000898E306|nr:MULTISPECIES: hypothetical protein [unclassified Paenibacillus]OMC68626.1 hypothetical protein BK126_12420 [Paenibacillus sp. FSL H7-0326]SDW56889.1 hypothetical protein SAMN05518848_102209 [Paenibacillus sp. PDC88]